MTRVEVVNRQEIAGKARKRGDVIEVAPAAARDLIAAGKVRAVAEKPSKPDEKQATAPAEKGGK